MSSSIFDLYTSSDAAKNILGGAGSGEGDIAKVNADVSDAQQSQIDSEYMARKRSAVRMQIDALKQKKANLEAQNEELRSRIKDIPDEEVQRIGEQLGVPDVAESWLSARTGRRNYELGRQNREDALKESQKTRSSIDKENALTESEQKNSALTQIYGYASDWATESNEYAKKAKKVTLEKAVENFNRRYPQEAISAEEVENNYGATGAASAAPVTQTSAPAASAQATGFAFPEKPKGLSKEQSSEWDNKVKEAKVDDQRGDTDKRNALVAELNKTAGAMDDKAASAESEKSNKIKNIKKSIEVNERNSNDTKHPSSAARAKNMLNGYYKDNEWVPGLYDQYHTLTGKAYGN